MGLPMIIWQWLGHTNTIHMFQHWCRTPGINITKTSTFSQVKVSVKRNMKAITTIDDTEDGICRMFRRRRSLCPSEASNLAPSLVSSPPPWVWPKVKWTIKVMRQHSFWNRCELFRWFPALGGELQYLVVFGPLGQIKGGVDFSGALLTKGRQLEGNRLSQTITRL